MPDSAGDLRRTRGKAHPLSLPHRPLPCQIGENMSDRKPGWAMMPLS